MWSYDCARARPAAAALSDGSLLLSCVEPCLATWVVGCCGSGSCVAVLLACVVSASGITAEIQRSSMYQSYVGQVYVSTSVVHLNEVKLARLLHINHHHMQKTLRIPTAVPLVKAPGDDIPYFVRQCARPQLFGRYPSRPPLSC
jgi:hypothetical protein